MNKGTVMFFPFDFIGKARILLAVNKTIKGQEKSSWKWGSQALSTDKNNIRNIDISHEYNLFF